MCFPHLVNSGDVDHTNFLSKDIGELYLSENYTDVTIIVEGQRFNGHKIILAARSLYFRALLFGGLKESTLQEIELKDVPLSAFKGLFKYIYTGRMSLADQREEMVVDILRLAHQYGFIELETATSDYLKQIMNIKNVCFILNAVFLYRLESLKTISLKYMDKHAAKIINHDSFLQLCPSALEELVSRDSFVAPEIEIFQAIEAWILRNSNINTKDVFAQVRLSLICTTDLLNIVRPTGLVSSEAILDVITGSIQEHASEVPYRGRLLKHENLACATHGAEVLKGHNPNYLLDGNILNYDKESGFTCHKISNISKDGILIKLGEHFIINHMKILLWDKDAQSYSYYIEVSNDQKHWVRIIDYTEYFCRSWQYLYFEPRVMLYIRIVGTHNTMNKAFKVVSFEAYYTNLTEKLSKGFIIPTLNVATTDCSVTVKAGRLLGTYRSPDFLLNGDTSDYGDVTGYTAHNVGSGNIMVQLGQPYIIDSMRLLLWDGDNRSYSYYIEVSGNCETWDVVADKTKELCKSWQILHFHPPRPVVFIRIVGTRNTANSEFHCVHFECPAQIDEKTEK